MKSNKSKISCKWGFTLIELLVVVLIIGILAAVAVPQYQKAVRKARIAEAKVILKQLTDAQNLYILGEEFYPIDMSGWNEVLDMKFPDSTTNWTFEHDECTPGCSNIATPRWESGYEIRYYSPNENYGDDDYAGHFVCAYDENICTGLGGVQSEDWADGYILP